MELPPQQPFTFVSLRPDWYAGNQAVPRAVRQTVEGTKNYVFVGFPRQWIPLFEWFGVAWKQSIEPPAYIPVFSDLSEEAICAMCRRARSHGVLRSLAESASMLDPVVSDFLYIVDNALGASSPAMREELEMIHKHSEEAAQKILWLTGWQSYGRPSLRALEAAVAGVEAASRIAVVLPCARTRPYHRSPTHRKIYQVLQQEGYQVEELHRIVLTSLGVLPEEVWDLPQVKLYDAGVPDIYRTLRLVRSYFGRVDYNCVLDCLQFPPYSDVLAIAQREHVIKKLVRIPVPKKRHFVLRP